jgi:hypothetical protein
MNILLTFAVGVAVMLLHERGQGAWAALVFVLGGALVEYWWPGLAVVVTAWLYFRTPTAGHALAAVASLSLLGVVNGSSWALLALPLVLLAAGVPLSVPRLRWLFWAFYPAHLAALSALVALGV